MATKIDPNDILAPRAGDTPSDTKFLAELYGFKFYRTRVRCRNDHASLRLASTGECLGCVAARYQRWKAQHPVRARARTNAHLLSLGKPFI